MPDRLPPRPLLDARLQRFQRFGVHLGLDRVRRLLADLGDPQDRVPLVHVAGTNGKGSVCAYVASVLGAAGYRVGRYTSPHLESWTERICLDGRPIPEGDLGALVETVAARVDAWDLGDDDDWPTQFEVFTAAAWLYFAREGADVAVVEVGLGGRLDATNVVDRPLVSAIVSVSREHWQVLGDTVAKIAGEKAGVVKADCPTVVGPLPPEARAMVERRARETGAVLVDVQPAIAVPPPDDAPPDLRSLPWARSGDWVFPLSLLGPIQLTNAAVAVGLLRSLQARGWTISREALWRGMAAARWPGRMQWLAWGDRPLLADGAHNPAAAEALRAYLDVRNNRLGEDRAGGAAPSVTWVVGILASKDAAGILRALLRSGDRCWTVPVPGHSGFDPADLAVLARSLVPDLDACAARSDLVAGLEAAFTLPGGDWGAGAAGEGAMEASDRGPVVLCGSLYLVGLAFSLGARPLPADPDRPT